MHNKFIFNIFLYFYFICGVTYGIHDLNYVDEFGVALLAFYFLRKIFQWGYVPKPLKILGSFVIFYIVYSFFIEITVIPAILQDAFQELKPFICFFCIYYLTPRFSSQEKKFLNRLSLICCLVCTAIWAFSGMSTAYELLIHPAYYGHIELVSAILYLYTSPKGKKHIFVFLILLLMGIICGRSKYYGEIVLAIFLFIFIKQRIRLNLKYIIYGAIVLILILYVSWGKVSFYYSYVDEGADAARPLLYIKSVDVFEDYFPWGAGLGTFGNDASRVYYSPLYDRYNLSSVYGLSRDFGNFIADTYYPVIIAQFGIIGILLFISFFYFIIKRLSKFSLGVDDINYKSGILMVASLLIECFASPFLVTSMGTSLLSLLAIILSDMKLRSNNIKFI